MSRYDIKHRFTDKNRKAMRQYIENHYKEFDDEAELNGDSLYIQFDFDDEPDEWYLGDDKILAAVAQHMYSAKHPYGLYNDEWPMA